MLKGSQQNTLELARQTYGAKNQIGVAIEELCELAAVLSKFGRYDNTEQAVQELKEKALDEFADASIVLEHVRAIFGFTSYDIDAAQTKKIDRLAYWLKNSESLEYTTKERGLPELPPVKGSTSVPGVWEEDVWVDPPKKPEEPCHKQVYNMYIHCLNCKQRESCYSWCDYMYEHFKSNAGDKQIKE